MIWVGLVAAVLGGLALVGLGLSWRQEPSAAGLRRTTLPFARVTALLVGASLVAVSTLTLSLPRVLGPGSWLDPVAVAVGLVAVAVGVDWVLGVRTYYDSFPRALHERTWTDRPAPARAASRLLPAAILMLGGVTVLIAA